MEIIDEQGNKVEAVPLGQMISAVQSFIFINTGRMVFIDPRVADDTRQLTMLGHAYDVATGKIGWFEFGGTWHRKTRKR